MSYTKTDTVRYRIDRFFANRVDPATPDGTAHQVVLYGRTKTGNYLPKWRNIIRSGGVATTVFDGVIDTIQADYVNMYALVYAKGSPPDVNKYIHYRHKESSFANWWSMQPLPWHDAIITDLITKARDRAIKSLYQKVYKAHHQVQGGVILGEIGKTTRLLAGTATKLKSGVLSYLGAAVGIRRGRGSNTSKRKAIANSYLEATFGWQPLIHDCKDIAEAIGRLCYESDRVRFTAIGSSEGQASRESGTVTFGSLTANFTNYLGCEVLVIYKGFLRGPKYEAGSPPAERIVSMAGFDLRSFVPTVWELIPYSFLVDYFTNIGDVLQAFSTDTSGVYGLQKSEVWETKRDINLSPDFKRSRTNLDAQYGASNIFSCSLGGKDGGFAFKKRTVSRTPSGMPLMVPQFTGFDLPWRQFANIGALFLGKMGTR